MLHINRKYILRRMKVLFFTLSLSLTFSFESTSKSSCIGCVCVCVCGRNAKMKQQKIGEHKLIVWCFDAVGRCGMLSNGIFILDMIRSERWTDERWIWNKKCHHKYWQISWIYVQKIHNTNTAAFHRSSIRTAQKFTLGRWHQNHGSNHSSNRTHSRGNEAKIKISKRMQTQRTMKREGRRKIVWCRSFARVKASCSHVSIKIWKYLNVVDVWQIIQKMKFCVHTAYSHVRTLLKVWHNRFTVYSARLTFNHGKLVVWI